jgi:hypothetical protein
VKIQSCNQVQACSFLKGEIENGGMNIFLGKAGAYAVFF